MISHAFLSLILINREEGYKYGKHEFRRTDFRSTLPVAFGYYKRRSCTHWHD